MKKAIAGAVLLAGLAVAGILANQAVQRDLEYRRFIAQGDEAVKEGQTFVAIEAYSGAIALDRNSMLAYLKRGEAHQRRGDTPETLAAALRDLRKATELDPGATRALEELGDVNAKLHRYANAAESYEAYLRLDDRSATVFYKLGLAARGDGRLGRAVSALRQSARLNSTSPEVHYVLGLCLKERDELKEARAAFEQAVRLAPAMIAAREELADVLRALGDWREEIEELEALAALDVEKPDRRIAVALAHLNAGNRDLAVTTLGRAAERFHDQPGIYTTLGRVWLEAAEEFGDPTDARKALEALERVAGQSSATSETLGLYGRALLLAGEPARAERAFAQAAQRFPIDPDVLPQLAELAQRGGRLDDARQALVRYSLLVDDDREAAAHAARVGDLSWLLNDAAGAAAWYEKSNAIDPIDPSRLARLAEAQMKTGRAESAAATVTNALEKYPGNTALLAAARRVQTR